ncbi:DUF6894 family protein [Bradyrhizobium sp.]|uniref:DUF6894 family protein n=1 Tax=Bradyrhizobium sp. TaxID=376 RepID=UPI003D0D3248
MGGRCIRKARAFGASVGLFLEGRRVPMRTFYFDIQDGVPSRDRRGLEFPLTSLAIEHSKELARRLRDDPRRKDPALSVVVLNEDGAEVHREPVYPDPPTLGMTFEKIG